MASIESILNSWESLGVFDFLLPFLLIFAVVFGILSTTNVVGKNKGVHLIIAFAIGLLSLRFGFVQQFFGEVFPRLGVGLAVILVILILIGLFVSVDERRYWLYGLATIGFVVALLVLVKTFDFIGWTSSLGFDGENFAAWIVGVIALVGVIVAVAVTGETKKKKPALIGPWNIGGE